MHRAAATLTAKFNLKLSQNMAEFITHSRWVHDKFYKMTMSEKGMLEAFNKLEIVQSNPFSDLSQDNLNVSVSADNQTHASINEILSESDLQNGVPFDVSTNIDSISSGWDGDFVLDINSCDSSSSITGVSIPHLQSSPRIANTSPAFLNSSPLLNHFNLDLANDTFIFDCPNDRLDGDSENFENISMSHSTPDAAIVAELYNDVTQDASYENSYSNENQSKIKATPVSSNVEQILKQFSINLERIEINQFGINRRNIKKNCSEIEKKKLCSKSIFKTRADQELFLQLFGDLIDRVKNYIPISKKAVIARAKSSKFKIVLQNMYGNAFLQLYNKVRTLGTSLRNPKYELNTSFSSVLS